MFLAILVSFMGHDDWTIREWATKVCNDPSCIPYLRHALTSENPELRNRAYTVVMPILRKQEYSLFKENPKEWYTKWLKSDAQYCLIDDTIIILDVSKSRERKEMLIELLKELDLADVSLGSWAEIGALCQQDYIALRRFRQQLKAHREEAIRNRP